MKYPFTYLLDENVTSTFAELLRQHFDLPFHQVGDGVAPPRGTPDPEILCWCEEHSCVLVTNNRKSMPGHLKDHLDMHRHIPGIFQIPSTMTIVELGEHLHEVAATALADEYRDAIHYLPIV